MSQFSSEAQAYEQGKGQRNLAAATTLQHDPVPDGRTGPFMRQPHLKNEVGGIGDTFDPRCKACRIRKGQTA